MQRKMKSDTHDFEEKIGIAFKDKELLRKAFVHRSYVNEHRDEVEEHNERLEFLGDAVLELVTTEYLYAKYPEKPEGELTAYRAGLVNTQTLSVVAKKLGMNDYLHLSRGEAKDTGRARQYILANTFEAFTGALYLDQGYAAAQAFIATQLFPLTEEIVEKRLWLDAKSHFQEKAQERVSITPTYKMLSESGPDHDRHFLVGVYLGSQLVAEGGGKSKQEAEQEAARRALEVRDWL